MSTEKVNIPPTVIPHLQTWLSALQTSVLPQPPSQIPTAMLSGEVVSVDDIFNTVRNILGSLPQGSHLMSNMIPKSTSALDHLITVSESLSTLLAKQLTREAYEKFTFQINAATTHWLHNFLRLSPNTRGYYRSTKQRARELLSKMALLRHFPTYQNEGYLAFEGAIPVIIASQNWYWLEELRYDLGLPNESVKIVRNSDHLRKLLESLQNDSQNKYRPFFLVGSAGGADGHVQCDNLLEFASIAEEHKIWCHVEGSGLFALAATNANAPEYVKAAWNGVTKADSFLFNALSLFGYDDFNKVIPTVFFRNDNLVQFNDKNQKKSFSLPSTPVKTKPTLPPPSTPVPQRAQPFKQETQETEEPRSLYIDHGTLTLNLWFAFQNCGCNLLRNQVDNALKLASFTYHKLSQVDSLSIITPPHTLQVVFRYTPLTKYLKNKTHEEIDKDLLPYLTLSFIEEVNQQLLTDMNSTSAFELDMDLVRISSDNHHETYIRFNPLFSPNLERMSNTLVEIFVDNLSLEAELINGTLIVCPQFRKIVNETKNGLIDASGSVVKHVGLGAVRYVPTVLIPQEYGDTIRPDKSLGPKVQAEVDRLNESIIQKLQEINPLYLKTLDNEKLVCIGVGVVDSTPVTNEKCSELIQTILQTAKEVESRIGFSEVIGKIITSGIKEAEARMKKETERVQAEKSLIRYIPIVGSVWNWWSPTAATPQGNSFNFLTTELTSEKPPKTPMKSSVDGVK